MRRRPHKCLAGREHDVGTYNARCRHCGRAHIVLWEGRRVPPRKPLKAVTPRQRLAARARTKMAAARCFARYLRMEARRRIAEWKAPQIDKAVRLHLSA